MVTEAGTSQLINQTSPFKAGALAKAQGRNAEKDRKVKSGKRVLSILTLVTHSKSSHHLMEMMVQQMTLKIAKQRQSQKCVPK